MVDAHVIVDVAAGDIFPVEEHDVAYREDVRALAFAQAEVFQITGRRHEDVLDVGHREEAEHFLRLRLRDEADIDLLVFEHRQRVGRRLALDRDLDMRIFLDKALEVIQHDETAERIADADADVAHMEVLEFA